jgi:hypothetical protein
MEYPEKQLITWVDDSGEYVGLCEYIRADLVPQWQPIETAPKDGTEIIGVYSNNYGYQDKPTVYGPWTVAFRNGAWMASWAEGSVIEYESYSGTTYKDAEMEPTHWMPLPAPPSP